MSHAQCMRLDRGLIVEIVVANGEVQRSGVEQHTLEDDHQIGWEKKKCGDWTGKELLE